MPTNDDADDDEKGQKAKYYSHKYLGKKTRKSFLKGNKK